MILDTDQLKHFIIMTKFKSVIANDAASMNDESNRWLSLSIALKCAGIDTSFLDY